MKRVLFFLLSFFFMTGGRAQKIKGQWKGEFIDKSSSFGNFAGDKCDYVIELEVKGDKLNGSSYTYFTEGGKRYYTICKLEGSYYKGKKYLEIKEVQRIKTNIPNNIRNCFQIHKLTYFKKDGVETLEGDWIPAPDQGGSCGFGNTILSKRTLQQQFPNRVLSVPIKNKPIVKVSNSGVPIKKSGIRNDNIAYQKSESADTKLTDNLTAKDYSNQPKVVSPEIEIPVEITQPDPKLEKRKNYVLKTIEVERSSIKIDLYDNGEVDGDSISLFFNGKLLLSNRKLTEKAITINLNIENDNQPNELVMFAENLGAIAPNTALMVVTDGPNRYEIRITSDLEKSGMIRFIRKSPHK